MMQNPATAIPIIRPNWPLTDSVIAGCTSHNTTSKHAPAATYWDNNFALNVTDDKAAVLAKRQQLVQQMQWQSPPAWLSQRHSSNLLELSAQASDNAAACAQQAYDGSYTRHQQQACIVMTADCLPLLLCDQDASVVAAIHAGWRGIAKGIIGQSVRALKVPAQRLYAWLGPAISQSHYQVDHSFYKHFIQLAPELQAAFSASNRDLHYQADLYQLARLQLQQLGVHDSAIYGGDYCTYAQPELFYSYRRDGKQSGRMASFISLR